MTIEEIRELINVVTESGIAELEVQRGDNRVRIRRNLLNSPQEIVLAPQVSSSVSSPGMPLTSGNPVLPQAYSAAAPSTPTALTDNTLPVKSPIVGTYYDAPSPGAPPFVKVGDMVEQGQVLCIIESMKLMNEIESEVAGTIAAKLIENGKPVEYGEALFTISPR
jgi:acetyl-CoA carboxylase biotin carboxyl carrier protein